MPGIQKEIPAVTPLTVDSPTDDGPLAALRDGFLRYASAFIANGETKDPAPYTLKRDHSLRVCGLSIRLGRSLDLEGSDMLVAGAIGLLHDIGRFDQYRHYQTFSDHRSVDHGGLAAKIVRLSNAPGLLPPHARPWIDAAIYHHNKFALPDSLTGESLLFTRLIRDADKIDIIGIVARDLQGKMPMPAGIDPTDPAAGDMPSEGILSALSAGSTADYRLACTATDHLLLRLGWVYDLNFRESFRILVRRGYLDALVDAVPKTSGVEPVIRNIRRHVVAALGGRGMAPD
ncbi:MAG: HD domain-containing protein [Desulfobacterales bacterium]